MHNENGNQLSITNAEPRELVLLADALRAVEEVKSLDDIKQLHSQVAAIQAYSREAQLGRQIELDAAVIKVQTERRLGKMLAQVELARGAPGNQHTGKLVRFPEGTGPTRLRDLGITKKESFRWQRLAKLPQRVFESLVAEALRDGVEPTCGRLLRHRQETVAAGVIDVPSRPAQPSQTVERLELLIEAGHDFATIYADPPWPNDSKASRESSKNHRRTMSVDDICNLPVGRLVRPNAHLHLWTTSSFLAEAFHVIVEWGFRYRSSFVWVKPQIGPGNYWRIAHEFLLLGVRGQLRFRSRGERSWLELPDTGPLRKPQEMRALIEKVSPGPYLELFGRDGIPNSGWTVFNDEVERRLV